MTATAAAGGGARGLDALDALHAEYARTGDDRLFERLVAEYAPLARHFAVRYRNSSEPLDDLVQVAMVGLCAALVRFDPAFGNGFPSYASRVILGELKKHFRDRTWSVHVARGLQERYLLVRSTVEDLRRADGRSPTIPELAAHLGLGIDAVLEAIDVGYAYRVASLDAPAGRGRSRGDGDGEAPIQVPAVDAGYDRVERDVDQHSALGVLLDRLTAAERELVQLYYGDGLTQVEIARRLGTSQVSVSRRLSRLLRRLRAMAGVDPTA